MKMKSTFIAATLLLVSVMTEGGLSAQNPIVQTCFTTDPAPMVHDGTLYVYTGHDEDKADFFWMQEWRVYSIRKSVSKVLSIKILIQKVHGFINGKENTIFFMLPEVYPNILPIP